MRGNQTTQQQLFSYVAIDDRIPVNHPLRALRSMVDAVLQSMTKQFDRLYSDTGRPSIAPEYLLRATVVQILYSIRSERLLMEQLNYNMLFRWFVGMSMDESVWDHSVFSKNRDRLLDGNIAQEFLKNVLGQASTHHLLSDEHFTVDGTLIEAWAGHKSFQKKDAPPSQTDDDSGNPTINFHGEQRTNDTHLSTTDPESRLYRKGKGKEAKLSFMGHVVIDNRHGLVVATEYTLATGKAERESAIKMIKAIQRRRKKRVTLGADKSYDTRDFVYELREQNVTPHVAQNTTNRSSAIDDRTTRHTGYEVSQWKRKIVEEVFGWLKTIGLLRKTRHKGVERGGWMFTFTNAVYNLVRMKNILTGTT